jgi:hypothetical protein
MSLQQRNVCAGDGMSAVDAQPPRGKPDVVEFPSQPRTVPDVAPSAASNPSNPVVTRTSLSTWRFYEGMNGEWRWYRLDSRGDVSGASDHSFGNLLSCMLNAEAHGFQAKKNYIVYARSLHTDPGGRQS